jgi:hypothetical protein
MFWGLGRNTESPQKVITWAVPQRIVKPQNFCLLLVTKVGAQRAYSLNNKQKNPAVRGSFYINILHYLS